MYSQQAYPSFTLTPGIMQDGFGGYHHHHHHHPHPSQAFFFPAMKADNGDLGEHQAQLMAWNHTPQMEAPGHLTFRAPPTPLLREESPCAVESKPIKEESEDSNGEAEDKHSPPSPYYTHAWSPAFWPGSSNLCSQPEKTIGVPGSNVYRTPASQSPETPAEISAANMESSRCSSAPAKEPDSSSGVNASSPGGQVDALSSDGEDVLVSAYLPMCVCIGAADPDHLLSPCWVHASSSIKG